MEHETSTQTSSPIREKSFALAVRIVNLYKFLTSEKHEYVLSKQILRSGTSPGANVREAQNAESKNDFVHKLGIAQKETAETSYWLELLHKTGFLNDAEFESLNKDTDEVLRMIRSSILTTKKNQMKDATKTIIIVLLSGYFIYQQII